MTTGLQRMEAAFSADGADELPAVLCYEGVFIRDHWSRITRRPWWYLHSPDLDHQVEWISDYLRRVDIDWRQVTSFYSREDREAMRIETAGEQVLLIDDRTGERRPLQPPTVSDSGRAATAQSYRPEAWIDTYDGVDEAIGEPEPFDAGAFADSGRADLARRLLAGPAADRLPVSHAGAPFWRCYRLWGFEGLMRQTADDPDLVAHACRRHLAHVVAKVRQAAAVGARAIWIEECFTDMISPDAFAAINLPVIRRLIDEIRAAGMWSIYYYCGDPWAKLDLLVAAGADALAFEEGKKDFEIDIHRVVDRVGGRCVVFGNLDAVGVLDGGDDALLREAISRQVDAGRRAKGRFVLSLGSPVTPGTPVSRIQRYSELCRELGRL